MSADEPTPATRRTPIMLAGSRAVPCVPLSAHEAVVREHEQRAELLRRQVAELEASNDALADQYSRLEQTARKRMLDVEAKHRAEVERLRGLLAGAITALRTFADCWCSPTRTCDNCTEIDRREQEALPTPPRKDTP